MTYYLNIPLEFYAFGDDLKVEAAIEYECSRETPASHDDPGAPSEIYITHIDLIVDGDRRKCPAWLTSRIENRVDREELLEAADYGKPYRDPDDARDERLSL